MKKKIAMMVLMMAIAVTTLTGCGTKQTGDQISQTTQESTITQNTSESSKKSDSQNEKSEDASTICGTLDEIKDFMFVVTDENGASYEFTYSGEKPEGLDEVKIGDTVTVTYLGEVSEVDPFEGEVLSVEANE